MNILVVKSKTEREYLPTISNNVNNNSKSNLFNKTSLLNTNSLNTGNSLSKSSSTQKLNCSNSKKNLFSEEKEFIKSLSLLNSEKKHINYRHILHKQECNNNLIENSNLLLNSFTNKNIIAHHLDFSSNIEESKKKSEKMKLDEEKIYEKNKTILEKNITVLKESRDNYIIQVNNLQDEVKSLLIEMEAITITHKDIQGKYLAKKNIIMKSPVSKKSSYKTSSHISIGVSEHTSERDKSSLEIERNMSKFDLISLSSVIKSEPNNYTNNYTSNYTINSTISNTNNYTNHTNSYTNNTSTYHTNHTNNYTSSSHKTKDNLKKSKEELDFEHLELRHNFNKINLIIERELQKKKAEIKGIKDEIFKLRQSIQEVNEEISKKSKELTGLKEMLLQYYHNILKDGTDTRLDGLTWVVRAIWKLGYDVQISKMPDFLDQEAILFIMQISKMIREYEIFKKKSDDLKCDITIRKKNESPRIQIKKNTIINNISNSIMRKKNIKYKVLNLDSMKENHEDPIIYESYLNYYRNKLIHYSKNEAYKIGWKQKIKEITKDNLLQDILHKNKVNEETVSSYNDLNYLIETKDKIEDEIMKLKLEEVKRLNNEFITQNYERRFNTTINEVLSAILGDPYNITKTLAKIKSDEKLFQIKKRLNTD